MFRRIFRPVVQQDCAWQIRMKLELDTLINSENIVTFIKSQRIRWLGHIYRMEKTRNTRAMTEWMETLGVYAQRTTKKVVDVVNWGGPANHREQRMENCCWEQKGVKNTISRDAGSDSSLRRDRITNSHAEGPLHQKASNLWQKASLENGSYSGTYAGYI